MIWLNYLLLDKNDITKVCGTMTYNELVNDLGFNRKYQLHKFIFDGKIYKDRYIIIEDEYKRDKRSYKKKLFSTSKHGTKYYANELGEFYSQQEGRKMRKLRGSVKEYTGHRYMTINVGGKEMIAKNVIAELFIDYYDKNKNYTMLIDNSDPRNVCVDNIYVVPNSEKRKEALKKRSKRVGLYKNNRLVNTFESTRKASKELYIDHSMVSKICNNKVKNKTYDLRWI